MSEIRSKTYTGFHMKCLLFLSDFRKVLKQNYIKIRTAGAELFHADGQMDRHNKTNSRFSQFCKTHLQLDDKKISLMYLLDDHLVIFLQ